MEIIFSTKLLHHSNFLFSPSSTQFNSTSNSSKSPVFLPPLNQKRSLCFKKTFLSSTSVSNSSTYGGWEDLSFIDDSNNSSKSHQFQHFLVSVGIDDKKHVFMFILGFMTALAISRVRVSSILVFPASVLIFAVGFSLGFVRQGGVGFSLKKASKDEIFKFSPDTLRNSGDLFSEMMVKITNLEKDMSGDLGLNEAQVGEFECYLNAIRSLSADIYQVKTVVEAAINDGDSKGELVDEGQAERNLNQKISRRKRETGARLSDISQFIGGLFQESASATKPNKGKDVLRSESPEPLTLRTSRTTNDQIEDSGSNGKDEEVKSVNSGSDSETSNNVIDSSPPEASRNEKLSQHVAEISVNGSKKVVDRVMNGNSRPERNEIQRLSSSEGVSNRNYSSQFMDNNGNFMNVGYQDKENILMPHDDLYGLLNLDVSMKSSGNDVESFSSESKVSNRYNAPSHEKKKSANGSYKFDFIERRERLDDQSKFGNQQKESELEEDSASSPISEDLVFNKHLTEATDLLKGARECLKSKADEDRAEFMLYKSARLLSQAAAMKPMSLLAVGQLGNTYLLHGELKLRVSRELRTILSRNEPSRGKSRGNLKVVAEQNVSKDKIASILVDVCEECEGLLVEAGRQYKMALSIDGSDVRALYNWGLALSYRAQLIADVGPEAASDADKVYLAAIDKFNAMMSRNKAYAPDALFRWGVALQQRSRLRPSNAKEKLKLLHQAKSLLEDALSMNSNNVQVREALMSCISELNYRRF